MWYCHPWHFREIWSSLNSCEIWHFPREIGWDVHMRHIRCVVQCTTLEVWHLTSSDSKSDWKRTALENLVARGLRSRTCICNAQNRNCGATLVWEKVVKNTRHLFMYFFVFSLNFIFNHSPIYSFAVCTQWHGARDPVLMLLTTVFLF